ncbi:unnamed protein product [Phyllotreta striolata]|uniref:Uncharacterized protein n=1 Tax=Phyllotreta striolata TaxID=444603 RepID=A0A9N9TXN8_PHYSR|nr:unnamed protein product [Phyllotreta striolata]
METPTTEMKNTESRPSESTNHQMFLPNYPYLVQSKEESQLQKIECPIVENVYYCQLESTPKDQCTLELLDGQSPQRCPIVEVNIQNSIIQQITRDEILVIPSTKLKILSKCQRNQYLEIMQPSLINIPKHCTIFINQMQFNNNEEIQEGKPIILPKLEIVNIQDHQEYPATNISDINFDGLFEINKIAKQLKPIQDVSITYSNNTPVIVTTTVFFIIGTLVIGLIIFRKTLMRRKVRKVRESDENRKNDSVIFSS